MGRRCQGAVSNAPCGGLKAGSVVRRARPRVGRVIRRPRRLRRDLAGDLGFWCDGVPGDPVARAAVDGGGPGGRRDREGRARPAVPGGDRRGRDAARRHRCRRLPRGLGPDAVDRGRRDAGRGARPGRRPSSTRSGRPTGSPPTSTGWAGEPARRAAGRGPAGAARRRHGHAAPGQRPRGRRAGRALEPREPRRGPRGARGVRRGGGASADHQHLRRHPAAAGHARTRRPAGRGQPERGADRPVGGRRARAARRRRPRPDRRAAGTARHHDPRGGAGAVRRAARGAGRGRRSTWCSSRR